MRGERSAPACCLWIRPEIDNEETEPDGDEALSGSVAWMSLDSRVRSGKSGGSVSFSQVEWSKGM